MLGQLRRFKSGLSPGGQYKFIVRRWDSVSDLELAQGLLSAEVFRRELTPQILAPAKLGSILVLAPHQDDEVIGAGGALTLAARGNTRIDVCFITDGGSPNHALAASVEEHCSIRFAEAARVAERLGAEIHRLDVSNAEPRPSPENLKDLGALIRRLRPEVIMIPWLLDSPAKHRMTNHLLWLADRLEELPACEVWGFQVHNMPLPNAYVDITEVEHEKRSLLDLYESEIAHVQRYDHIAMGMNAWNSHLLPPSTEARYIEIFCVLPLKEHLELIGRFYFGNLRQTYRGDSSIQEAMSQLHRRVT